MAIGIMFVLTITVSSVMVYTAASAGHANNSNAGQKAYALAEAGVNNAFAVLNANYHPGMTVAFPGDPAWLPASDDDLRHRHRNLERDACRSAGPISSVAKGMANHVHRQRSESDRARGRAGDAQGDRHRADRHSADDAGERDRSAELPLFGLRHVVPELGARQGPGVCDAGPALGIHGRDRRRGEEGSDRPRPVPQEPAEPDWPHGRRRPADRRDSRGELVLVEEDRRRCTPADRRTPNGTTTRSLRRSTTT